MVRQLAQRNWWGAFEIWGLLQCALCMELCGVYVYIYRHPLHGLFGVYTYDKPNLVMKFAHWLNILNFFSFYIKENRGKMGRKSFKRPEKKKKKDFKLYKLLLHRISFSKFIFLYFFNIKMRTLKYRNFIIFIYIFIVFYTIHQGSQEGI